MNPKASKGQTAKTPQTIYSLKPQTKK